MIKIYWSYLSRMVISHLSYWKDRNEGAFKLRNALISVTFNERKLRHQGWYDERLQQ